MIVRISAREKPDEFIQSLIERGIEYDYRKFESFDMPLITVMTSPHSFTAVQLTEKNKEKILNKLPRIKDKQEKQEKT